MMSDYMAVLLVRAMAVQAGIEAMKAANAQRFADNRPPQYDAAAFNGAASDLQNIAHTMDGAR